MGGGRGCGVGSSLLSPSRNMGISAFFYPIPPLYWGSAAVRFCVCASTFLLTFGGIGNPHPVEKQMDTITSMNWIYNTSFFIH